MSPWQELRLLLGLATGVIVSLTAYFCAWLSFRDYHYFVYEQFLTRMELERLRDEVAQYREQNGHLPASLADLSVVKRHEVTVDEAGRPVDVWGRPFQYQVEGDTYELYSLGRDGQPGGAGLDADLYADREDPASEHLTLWQFTTFYGTNGIKLTCLLAGILAFPLCLLDMRKEAANRPSLMKVVLTHGITAAFAVLAAVVISILHLPSGH